MRAEIKLNEFSSLIENMNALILYTKLENCKALREHFYVIGIEITVEMCVSYECVFSFVLNLTSVISQ